MASADDSLVSPESFDVEVGICEFCGRPFEKCECGEGE